MENNLPKVSFGIVNCNRLFYLKSCFESLVECTKDYENKEIFIVDNASIEVGTDEYLKSIEDRGYKVFRQNERDPANEFAKALNLIARESTGEFICPLQGDMQFIIRSGWLKEYVEFFQDNIDNVGCILFDAQRSIRNESNKYSEVFGNDFKFTFNLSRFPVNGAADVMYSRKMLDKLYPWNEDNKSHEGGEDSETHMLKKAKALFENVNDIFFAMPIMPASVAIYTDSRGTNARVRNNRRYGDYWPPKSTKNDFQYYDIFEFDEAIMNIKHAYDVIDTSDLSLPDVNEKFAIPIGIEKAARPINWDKPVDADGNWLKNPIDPKFAVPSDYKILYGNDDANDIFSVNNLDKNVDEAYVVDWLESE
jgi:hypothetical protein